MSEAHGSRAPGWLDSRIMAATSAMPNNWLGLRAAIVLRRIVTMRLGDDGGLDVVRFGWRLRLHPRRNGCEKNMLFTPQMYEVPERAELFAEIDKAKAAGRAFVFVDIGANVGLFSFLVASRTGGAARILAIEPEPENLRRLRFNAAANPGVPIRVIPLAFGEADGRVVIDPNLRDRGGTRTRPATPGDSSAAIVVECRPLLPVLIEEQITSIDALKIDVEGAEDRILVPFFRDAGPSLWPSLIVIEDARNTWRSDLFSMLAACGYSVVSRSKLNVMLRRSVM
jgi:FkbM family methyltransferase